MLRVKVSSRGSGPSLNISQFVGNDTNEWMGCRFFINEHCENPDVWIISEDVDDWDTQALVSPESVIFVSAETSWESGFYEQPGASKFLDQFAWIYTCHDIYRPNVTAALPFLPWMINANHGPSISAPHKRDLDFFRSLESLEKTAELSVICSNQTLTSGHRMRLRLVHALKEHFGERLSWFGNGVQSIDEKWEGLAPFKYTIALENHVAWNVATEKVWDPFLSLTVPIYGGAPNLNAFVPQEAFIPIDVKDLNGSIATIEETLGQDRYESRLNALREAKTGVLGPLNLYSRLAEIAKRHFFGGSPQEVAIRPLSELGAIGTGEPTIRARLRGRLGQIRKGGPRSFGD